MSIEGGTATILLRGSLGAPEAWDDDGILLGGVVADAIRRIPSDGGEPETLVRLQSGERAIAPQMLPGGETVLFTFAPAFTAGDWDNAHIVVQSLKSGE